MSREGGFCRGNFGGRALKDSIERPGSKVIGDGVGVNDLYCASVFFRVHGTVPPGEARDVGRDGRLKKSGSGWSGAWVHGDERVGRVIWTEGAGVELCGEHVETLPDRQHPTLRVQVLNVGPQDAASGDSQGLVLDGLEFVHIGGGLADCGVPDC